MGIPDAILLKPGDLTAEEWTVMRRHPQYAYDLLWPVAFLRPALDIPLCHHERWDGQGYPRGLKGTAIPLAARIFAVVDVWDALRSDRPYRAAWSDDRVRAHLLGLAGTHLDTAVVAAFIRILDRGDVARAVATVTPSAPAPLPADAVPAPQAEALTLASSALHSGHARRRRPRRGFSGDLPYCGEQVGNLAWNPT